MLRSIDAFLDTFFGPVGPLGRLWQRVGLVTLAVAMVMSAKFGFTLSFLHAITLGVVGLFTAFVPDAAVELYRNSRKALAVFLGVVVAPVLFVIEFYSHAGYTSGLRGVEITDARVANVKHDDKRGDVASSAAAVAFWQGEIAKLRDAGAWAATTTADAERAKLPGLELAISQEARRGGCKSKCLERTRERDDVNARIATIEKIDEAKGKLEAAEKALAAARGVAGKSEFKASAVDMQQRFLGRVAAFVTSAGATLEPTEFQAEAAEFSASNLIALALTFLPALAFLLAGTDRVKRAAHEVASAGLAAFGGGQSGGTPGERASDLSVINNRITDRGTAKHAADALAYYRAKAAGRVPAQGHGAASQGVDG